MTEQGYQTASDFTLAELVCDMQISHETFHTIVSMLGLEQVIDEMPADHIHIPDGNAADPQTECARYDQAIAAAGGIDIQVLGIGRNGHIGFNEPDDHFTCGCLIPLLAKFNSNLFCHFGKEFVGNLKQPRRSGVTTQQCAGANDWQRMHRAAAADSGRASRLFRRGND